MGIGTILRAIAQTGRDLLVGPDDPKGETRNTLPAPTARAPHPTITSLTTQLNDEKRSRARAESELLQVKSKLKAIQLKWKKTATHLDKVLSQARGFNQVTDEELKEMAMQLQYNIRNFAIQYFSESSSPPPQALERDSYEGHIPKYCEPYMKQPEQYPLLVEHFLWRVLTDHIFERFLWAGASSQALGNLWGLFVYSKGNEFQTLETIQKLHTWRATTTGMVLECPSDNDTLCNAEMKERIVVNIQQVLNALSDKDYDDELHNILDAAIKMDRVICSQVARVSWRFENTSYTEHGLKLEPPEQGGVMVAYPAIVKRGKSNGEDFELESVLLPGGGVFLKT
ncbi:hypothetical protein GGR53DRAFT_515554 [Hypoxylon sp. FL1150]|nr:hypothetical protein GGR53DRAFT_515554 [Hypoxylon sp. FL1150]